SIFCCHGRSCRRLTGGSMTSTKGIRVCLEFDECKPHWAEQRGWPGLAADCGLQNLSVTGDFDSKITRIYGDVEDFDLFKSRIAGTALGNEGSLSRVDTSIRPAAHTRIY